MIYTDEHKILSDLNNCFKDLDTIDIDLYELINSYLDNQFNISADELKKIQNFISQHSRITKEYAIYYNNDLANKFDHIVPCKMAKPVSPIKKITIDKKELPDKPKIVDVTFKTNIQTVSNDNAHAKEKVFTMPIAA